MKANVILADTIRPTGTGTLSLLNAGWTFTSGPPQPGQSVAIFLEVPWDRLNRQIEVVCELHNEEGQIMNLATPAGDVPAQIVQPVLAPNVPGAPNGTPGAACVFFELGPGVLQLPAGHRYVWRVSIDGEHDEAWEAAFFVAQPILQGHIGGLSASP